jgi:hypothetical protein
MTAKGLKSIVSGFEKIMTKSLLIKNWEIANYYTILKLKTVYRLLNQTLKTKL